MLKSLMNKLLTRSGSYNHYRNECKRLGNECKHLSNECERLSNDCELLRDENRRLHEDVLSLLESLNDKQDMLYSSFNESEVVSETAKILDALNSYEHHLSKKVEENRKLLESLNDASMRIEKSSAYTNLKLDSKFDENKRFITDEVLGKL